jgi:hypothetical protein
MVVRYDTEGWFIYTPEGERLPYSLQNITMLLQTC